jgi:hypothetical protein
VLEAERATFAQQLEAIIEDRAVLAEYERRVSSLAALTTELEALGGDIADKTAVLSGLLEMWLGPVKAMVKQIDTCVVFVLAASGDGLTARTQLDAPVLCAHRRGRVPLCGRGGVAGQRGGLLAVRRGHLGQVPRGPDDAAAVGHGAFGRGAQPHHVFVHALAAEPVKGELVEAAGWWANALGNSAGPVPAGGRDQSGVCCLRGGVGDWAGGADGCGGARMDADKERLAFYRLQAVATGQKTPQYFVITPKLLTGLRYTEDTTVLFVFNGQFNLPQKDWDVKKMVEEKRKRVKTIEA